MNIQLQSLRVINCGPLRDVCIHFNTNGDRPVTLLAGANGSGKTTALELIVGLAEMLLPFSSLPPIRSTLAQAEYARMDWLVDEERVSLFFGQTPAGSVLPENYFGRSGLPGGFTEQESGQIIRKTREYIRQQETADIVGPLNDAPDAEDGIVQTDRMPSILFFPHTRFLLPVIGEQIHKEAVTYQWVYVYQILNNFKGSLDSYLVWLEYVEPENYTKVINFLNALEIEGKTFSISRRDLKAIVSTPSGGTHFLSRVS